MLVAGGHVDELGHVAVQRVVLLPRADGERARALHHAVRRRAAHPRLARHGAVEANSLEGEEYFKTKGKKPLLSVCN